MFIALPHWCITEPPLNFLRYLSSLSLSLEPCSCTSGLHVPVGHQLPRLRGGRISPDLSSLWSAAGKEPRHPSTCSWPAVPVYSDPQTFLNLPISLQPHCTPKVRKPFFIPWTTVVTFPLVLAAHIGARVTNNKQQMHIRLCHLSALHSWWHAIAQKPCCPIWQPKSYVLLKFYLIKI